MRPVRRVDPADLWFGVVFGVIAVGVFALYAIWFWDTATTSRTFWPNLLTMLSGVVVGTLLRARLDRAGRAPRLVLFFCIGFAAVTLTEVSRGRAIGLAVVAAAVGVGLVFVIFDALGEYFRSKRQAEDG
jgi:hypothetical protein